MFKISTYLSFGVNPGLYSTTFAFSACDRSDLLHNTRTYSSHLRTVVRARDRCDRVTTECRTCHKKLIVLLLLVQLLRSAGNRRSQACVQSAVRPVFTRAETVGPRSRPIAVAPTKHDLRLVLIDHRCQCMCVRLCSVVF